VRFCMGVRWCGGCSFGGSDVSVHRCGGFDPSLGSRRARDAGGVGRPRRGVAQGDPGARGLLFKHTGGGVCAAFSSPKSAVDAAIAAQLELELPVRMRLATGEAELRDGDYLGTVLKPRCAGKGRRAPVRFF
jgi:class 3 adenylate cyclase